MHAMLRSTQMNVMNGVLQLGRTIWADLQQVGGALSY
jgi:hypothetical protein